MGTVTILRRVTKIVKVFPFLYALLLLVLSLFASYGSFEIAEGLFSLFYMSILVMLYQIHLSYALKLCIWHKLQCILPIFPQIIANIDAYVYEFGANIAVIESILNLAILSASLLNAYFVFIKPSANETKRN